MTPKEKVDDLINQMWQEIDKEPASHDAKMCALVAVDEIIKSLENDAGNWIKWDETKQYWLQVKQEILNRI